MSSTTTTTTTTTTTATTAATPSGYTTGTSLKAKGVSRLDSAVVPDYREVRRRDHHEADIVIVGAGIVGCAAAVAFGKQGRSVILLERSLKEPDRIVGELLQPGGVRALEKLGMRGRSMSCFSCYYHLLPPPFSENTKYTSNLETEGGVVYCQGVGTMLLWRPLLFCFVQL